MSDYHDVHDDEYVIRKQDYSHSYTTDADHVVELYKAAVEMESKKILELGSYKGISTVALALAARKNNGFVCSVDLCDEIGNDYRIQYFQTINPPIMRYIFPYKESAMNYLKDENNPKYDFIFQDAGHGDGVIPELLLCWQKTTNVFAMHDFDAITDKDAFIKNLSPSKFTVSSDPKGRMLAIFYK